MLLCLQICFWVNGCNLVIDSSHSFWKYLDSLCILKRQDTSMKEQAAFKHRRITKSLMTTLLYLWYACQCLIVDLLLGFIEHLLSFVLSIKLYQSFLHELFPHFLCLRHQVSLDDITHVAKIIRSVRLEDLCGVKGDQWIDCQTSTIFLQQNHTSAFVSKWCEGQLWFGLPVHVHALRHTYLWNIIE